jgi:hypothetical protein
MRNRIDCNAAVTLAGERPIVRRVTFKVGSWRSPWQAAASGGRYPGEMECTLPNRGTT